MNISLQNQAILLMTARLARLTQGDPKPLTPTEWGRFAAWLKSQNMSPEVLLTSSSPEECLQGWLDPSVTTDRIRHLLARSGALGLSLEKWQRAGLWVMTRSDCDYPVRLKRRLKFDAPPVLFGCGNRQLLDQGGVAVVGSRAAGEEDLRYASWLGGELAIQGVSVISGGARGVDETAMLGTLEREGTAVGVLADSLLRAATSTRFRKALMSNDLALVSPFSPEAGFDVGNAMRRNRYIYCLADAGVVVATSKDSGGTWNGATENLKNGWVPLWVKESRDPDSGNVALLRKGARCLSEEELDFSFLSSGKRSYPVSAGSEKGVSKGKTGWPETSLERLSFYEIFLGRLEALTSQQPVRLDELMEKVDVNSSQVKDWLKRAEAEGRVSKLKKPLRYASAGPRQPRLDL